MDRDASDEALLKAFVAGDDASLGELASRYETSLLGLASGLLGGRSDTARDAVQDTWIRVIRYGGSFNGKASVGTWLYRITINRCRDLLKKGRRVPETGDRTGPGGGQAPAEHRAGVEDRNVALRRAVERLAADKREVILLCYHGDLTHEQAAQILEIPVGTLKSRLHAALNELRDRLSSEVVR